MRNQASKPGPTLYTPRKPRTCRQHFSARHFSADIFSPPAGAESMRVFFGKTAKLGHRRSGMRSIFERLDATRVGASLVHSGPTDQASDRFADKEELVRSSRSVVKTMPRSSVDRVTTGCKNCVPAEITALEAIGSWRTSATFTTR